MIDKELRDIRLNKDGLDAVLDHLNSNLNSEYDGNPVVVIESLGYDKKTDTYLMGLVRAWFARNLQWDVTVSRAVEAVRKYRLSVEHSISF